MYLCALIPKTQALRQFGLAYFFLENIFMISAEHSISRQEKSTSQKSVQDSHNNLSNLQQSPLSKMRTAFPQKTPTYANECVAAGPISDLSILIRCSALEWYCILCCSVLQRVAACCSVLQCVAVHCNVLKCICQCAAVCCSALQCAAVCCSVLQGVTGSSSLLQCVAVCCSVLQRVPVEHLSSILILPNKTSWRGSGEGQHAHTNHTHTTRIHTHTHTHQRKTSWRRSEIGRF